MLHDVSQLLALTPRARDGEIGKIHDVYFSDADWAVRYLVVRAGGWLTGRNVLLAPRSVQAVDLAQGELRIDLTREQISNSPDYDRDKPVSRQYEEQYSTYYGYPYYWTGPYLWGASAYPVPPGSPVGAPRPSAEEEHALRLERSRDEGDPHLRSSNEVTGYVIEASDGEIGHVETLLFDDVTWRIRALVIDTKNWWPGKHVIVAPAHVQAIDWNVKHVRVDLTRERIKHAAEYDAGAKTAEHRERRVGEIEHALRTGE